MKACFIFTVFLLILSSVVGAETVMIDVKNDGRSDYITEESLRFAVAIEDGVMAPFFDNGHIVFNFGISTERQVLPNGEESKRVTRVAKRGGASHLLEVQLGSEDTASGLPAIVTFILFRTGDGIAIAKGSVHLDEVLEDGINAIQTCRSIGEEVAQRALRTW